MVKIQKIYYTYKPTSVIYLPSIPNFLRSPVSSFWNRMNIKALPSVSTLNWSEVVLPRSTKLAVQPWIHKYLALCSHMQHF